MSLIDFSIRRPVTVFIVAVAGIVFGVVALGRLATDLLPDITYPSVTVETGYAGAAPIEVESLITRPIENAVGVVNGVERVTSSSRADASEVTLEFAWGTNMDLAGLDVRERLDVLRLPDAAERPVLLRYNPSLDPILRIGVHGKSDLIALRRLAEEDVKRSLERIEGVAAAVVSGGLEEEIHVEVDERQLANLGLSVERVVSRLGAENVNLTGGRLREGQSEYLVRTVDELVRASDLEAIVIDSGNGASVRLADIARVSQSHRERDIITRIDGEESVEVAIYKEGGTNTVTVSDTVTASLGALRTKLAEIDPGLKLTIITDQARYIRQSVSEVLDTAYWGGALAVCMLFFFLKSWKATAIIGIAIPISVVTTFFLMYVGGISLNIMSLGGLTLGIGMLVDNAIVVLEAIDRRRAEGLEPREAAIRGAGEVGTAVIASTLTTICVFLPIAFLEGVAGQLFGDQALTVTFSLVISLIVALTLIPMLAARRLTPLSGTDARASAVRGGLLGRTAFAVAVALGRVLRGAVALVGRALGLLLWLPLALFDRALDLTKRAYAWALARALGAPLLALLTAAGLFAASLSLYPYLGSELVPELIQGELNVTLELRPGTRLDVTARRLARLEQRVRAHPEVRTVYSIAGSSNEQGGVAGEKRENVAQLTLMLHPPISREGEERLMDELRREFDSEGDLKFRFARPSYFSFRTPIEVEIGGYNLKLLERLSSRLVEELRAIPGLADVRSSTEGGNPELLIHFDRERLASLGLALSSVAETVRSKVQGTVATDIQREDRKVDIRLRAAERYRDSVQDLATLTIEQRGKTAIPLSAVASIERAEGPAEIRRAEGERVALVTANLSGRDLAAVSADIESALGRMTLPEGFSARIGGQREEMATSFDSMRTALLLAVFLVYLVMASQFESLIHPLVIMFSVPFSLIGVLATLYLCHVTISVVVLIGVILLTGIVVNNAILLVDCTNRLRREGVEKLEALRQAGQARLRPILMTTGTTVLGLAPMALGLGEGSELRTPMALTVMGGLSASTLLTLLVIPAVYCLLDRSRDLAPDGDDLADG